MTEGDDRTQAWRPDDNDPSTGRWEPPSSGGDDATKAWSPGEASTSGESGDPTQMVPPTGAAGVAWGRSSRGSRRWLRLRIPATHPVP